MKNCPQCNTLNQEEAARCSACGFDFAPAETAPSMNDLMDPSFWELGDEDSLDTPLASGNVPPEPSEDSPEEEGEGWSTQGPWVNRKKESDSERAPTPRGKHPGDRASRPWMESAEDDSEQESSPAPPAGHQTMFGIPGRTVRQAETAGPLDEEPDSSAPESSDESEGDFVLFGRKLKASGLPPQRASRTTMAGFGAIFGEGNQPGTAGPSSDASSPDVTPVKASGDPSKRLERPERNKTISHGAFGLSNVDVAAAVRAASVETEPSTSSRADRTSKRSTVLGLPALTLEKKKELESAAEASAAESSAPSISLRDDSPRRTMPLQAIRSPEEPAAKPSPKPSASSPAKEVDGAGLFKMPGRAPRRKRKGRSRKTLLGVPVISESSSPEGGAAQDAGYNPRETLRGAPVVEEENLATSAATGEVDAKSTSSGQYALRGSSISSQQERVKIDSSLELEVDKSRRKKVDSLRGTQQMSIPVVGRRTEKSTDEEEEDPYAQTTPDIFRQHAELIPDPKESKVANIAPPKRRATPQKPQNVVVDQSAQADPYGSTVEMDILHVSPATRKSAPGDEPPEAPTIQMDLPPAEPSDSAPTDEDQPPISTGEFEPNPDMTTQDALPLHLSRLAREAAVRSEQQTPPKPSQQPTPSPDPVPQRQEPAATLSKPQPTPERAVSKPQSTESSRNVPTQVNAPVSASARSNDGFLRTASLVCGLLMMIGTGLLSASIGGENLSNVEPVSLLTVFFPLLGGLVALATGFLKLPVMMRSSIIGLVGLITIMLCAAADLEPLIFIGGIPRRILLVVGLLLPLGLFWRLRYPEGGTSRAIIGLGMILVLTNYFVFDLLGGRGTPLALTLVELMGQGSLLLLTSVLAFVPLALLAPALLSLRRKPMGAGAVGGAFLTCFLVVPAFAGLHVVQTTNTILPLLGYIAIGMITMAGSICVSTGFGEALGYMTRPSSK